MDRRTARREAELERVLAESRQQSKLELSRLQALHADEIRAKDALVHGFRTELDGLLRAAGQLMNKSRGGDASGRKPGYGSDGRDKDRMDEARRDAGMRRDAAAPVWGVVSS